MKIKYIIIIIMVCTHIELNIQEKKNNF